jgi:hypothetical protein
MKIEPDVVFFIDIPTNKIKINICIATKNKAES